MKALIASAMALLLCSNLLAGVTFIDGSWAEARALAKEQNKYILVDAYTDWCYWCKVQDKETFSRDDVGEMVNANFVSVKINFEQGIGIDLAMKYRVQGYPTLLFFNPEGRLVGRVVGYNSDPAEWITEVQGMLDTEKHPPSAANPDELDPGFPEFYGKAFGKGGQRARTDAETVSAWLDEQKDLYSEVVFSVIKCLPTNETWSAFFLDNSDRYTKTYGAEVEDKITSIIGGRAYAAAQAGDMDQLEAALQLAEGKLDEETVKGFRSNFMMEYYAATEAWEEYAQFAKTNIVEVEEPNSGYINSIAWNLYERCTDKAVLAEAASWMEPIVTQEPEYAYLDTYAALLFASDQLELAESWAKRAIAIGEAAEENVDATKELLTKIQEAGADE